MTSLPRGSPAPEAAVEGAVAAVSAWAASVLVLGPSFVRVMGLGQKMLDVSTGVETGGTGSFMRTRTTELLERSVNCRGKC